MLVSKELKLWEVTENHKLRRKTKELGFQERWSKIILGNVEKAVTGKLHIWNMWDSGKVRIRGQTWSSLDATALIPRLVGYLHWTLYKVQKRFCLCLFFCTGIRRYHWIMTVGLPYHLRYSKVKMFGHLLETEIYFMSRLIFFTH